jgi:hypothetical protein
MMTEFLYVAIHSRVLASLRLRLRHHLNSRILVRNQWLSHFVSFAFSLASLVFIAESVHAHSQGMFATKEQAEKRAAELKCQGVFVMESLWMPCANERALHNALQKK